jgi:hypothetical protein
MFGARQYHLRSKNSPGNWFSINSPPVLQIVTCNGPSNRSFVLCGAPVDAAHIFICSLASFAWSVLCQLLGCNWRPANFVRFHHIVSSLTRYPCFGCFSSRGLGHFGSYPTSSLLERKFLTIPLTFFYKIVLFMRSVEYKLQYYWPRGHLLDDQRTSRVVLRHEDKVMSPRSSPSRCMFGVLGYGRVGAGPFLRVGSVLLCFSMLFFSSDGLAKLYAATCL